jgi:hypothetical protein
MVSSLKTGILASLLAMGLVACGAAAEESFDEATPSDSDELKPRPEGIVSGSTKLKGLALGDSIAFGMDPLVQPPGNPASYKGYPEVISMIAGKKVGISNASCPGETIGGFLDAAAPDNGCRQWKALFSLHANYETTQIAFAESFINSNPDTKYVSIGVGANDLFLLQRSCLGDVTCINNGMPALLTAYGQKLGQIFTRLRTAGFAGKFIGVSTYATNYNDPLSVGALTALNNVLNQVVTSPAVGGKLADGFLTFKNLAAVTGGDACAAGLLIKKPDGTCDIHPSPLGRDELAKVVVEAAK